MNEQKIYVTQEEQDEIEKSFKLQRNLSFKFGFVFFLITLLIPFLSGTAEWWYGKPIIGGFTLNFLTSLLFFHIIYWTIAYVFVKKANKLDDELSNKKNSGGK